MDTEWLRGCKYQPNLHPKQLNEELKRRILEGLNGSNIPVQSIVLKTGVHKSQISRFKAGKFRRLSKNLRKICEEMRISYKFATSDRDLIAAVHDAWDGSAEKKRKLILILKTLGDWP